MASFKLDLASKLPQLWKSILPWRYEHDAYHVLLDRALREQILLLSLAINNSGIMKTQVFTASGTFTWPSGVDFAYVTLQAGGGGGGKPNTLAASSAGGGGAGECLWQVIYPRGSDTTETVVIGAAGVGATSTNTAGGDAATCSFGIRNASGGKGGPVSAGSSAGGNGGGRLGAVGAAATAGVVGTSNNYDFGGSSGGGGVTVANGTAGGPCGEFNGGAGGTASAGRSAGGGGASSFFGVGGAGGNGGASPTAGGVGTSYGAGGGGGGEGATPANGGNGGGGYCLVEWFG